MVTKLLKTVTLAAMLAATSVVATAADYTLNGCTSVWSA